MFYYSDILCSKTRKELNEHSLTRVYQHFLNSKEKSFAILTSWNHKAKTTQGQNQNIEDFKKLRSILNSQQPKLGFFQMEGHWKETNKRTQEVTSFDEPSLFVIGIPLELAKSIMAEFNQQSIVYSGPETNGSASWIWANGNIETIGKFSPNKIAAAYSQLKGGRSFVFEYSRPEGFMEAMGKQIFEKSNGGPLDVTKLLDE